MLEQDVRMPIPLVLIEVLRARLKQLSNRDSLAVERCLKSLDRALLSYEHVESLALARKKKLQGSRTMIGLNLSAYNRPKRVGELMRSNDCPHGPVRRIFAATDLRYATWRSTSQRSIYSM